MTQRKKKAGRAGRKKAEHGKAGKKSSDPIDLVLQEASREPRSAWKERLPILAVGLIFFLLVGSLAATRLQLGWIALTAPGPNTVGEAGKVYFAQRFQHGQSLFLSGDEAPFYSSFHGALVHASVGLAGRLSDASTIDLYYIGRGISLLCTVVVLVLCALLFRRWNIRLWWLIPLVLVFFAARRATQHSFSYRPDNWLLMLSVLSCYLVATRPGRRWALAVVTIAPVLAFFVKATGAVLLPIVVGALLVQKRTRDAALCAVAGAALMATSISVTNALSDGAFLAAMRNASGVGYSFKLVFDCLNVPVMWLPLFMPVFLLHRVGLSEPEPARERAVVTVFWAANFLVACLTASRLGSNSYYFLEAFLFGLLLTVSWLADAIKAGEPGRRGSPHTVAVGLILVLSVQAAPKLFPEMSYIAKYGRPRRDIALSETMKFHKDRQTIVEQVKELALEEGAQERYEWLCLSDDPGLNVLLDDPAMIHPLVASMMIKQDLLDADALVEPLRQGRVAMVVLTGRKWRYEGINRLPTPVQAAIKKYYRSVDSDTRYSVLVPIAAP